MSFAIEFKKINKSFKQRTVLDNIDFEIKQGKIVGLIGPSGAGKTTMIKIILGMEEADSGITTILGHKMPKS